AGLWHGVVSLPASPGERPSNPPAGNGGICMRSSVRGIVTACLLAAIGGFPARALATCTDIAAVCATRDKAEIQCPCAAATNHGQYVRCVAGVAKGEVDALRLPRPCKSSVVRCAARSTCGKPGFVTCCRTDSVGKIHCSIRRD